MIAVISLAGDADRRARFRIVACFIAGLAAAYACFGVFASLLGTLAALTHWIYAAVALGLGVTGVLSLTRPSRAHQCAGATPRSLGAVFLLGGSFAFVISPCCTPILIAVLSYCAQTQNTGYAAALLCVFAMGHSVPLLPACMGWGWVARMTSRFALTAATEVVAGTLLLSLAAYYLCLA